ncbi:unnamed protein product [Ectocarpus fasciculatus]
MRCVLRGAVWLTPPGLNRITLLADLTAGIPVVLMFWTVVQPINPATHSTLHVPGTCMYGVPWVMMHFVFLGSFIGLCTTCKVAEVTHGGTWNQLLGRRGDGSCWAQSRVGMWV